MKTNSIYQNSKSLLKSEAKKIKALSNDKGYIRMYLNDCCDDLIKQLNHYAMKETISEKQAKQYANWLSNYTSDLHPKD